VSQSITVQRLILGIIGDHVGRILCEIRDRPSDIVAETEAGWASAQSVATG